MFETDGIIIFYSIWAALFFTSAQLEPTCRLEKLYDCSLAVAGYFLMLRDFYLHPDHLDLHGLLASILLSAGLLVCFDRYCAQKFGQEDDRHFWD